MVREMRQAREAENEPQLVATLIPFPILNVKLRIHNVGRGPALSVKAEIRLEPANNTQTSTWLHPAVLSNAFEDFILPGREFSLEKLASQHDEVIIDLHWLNSLSHSRSANFRINLKQQKEGWDKVGLLVHPDDTATQLGKIKDELTHIRKHFDKIENDRIHRELLRQYQETRNPLSQLRERIAQQVQKLFQRKKRS